MREHISCCPIHKHPDLVSFAQARVLPWVQEAEQRAAAERQRVAEVAAEEAAAREQQRVAEATRLAKLKRKLPIAVCRVCAP